MTQFAAVPLGSAPKMAQCLVCAALIVDDPEGSNRADHAAMHEAMAALIDGPD